KRTSQWHQWTDVVIPSLLKPYLEYKRVTKSGRMSPPAPEANHMCKCNTSRILQVTLATWSSFRNVSITACPCHPSALQLLNLGYFPCAPNRPNIAFDLNLLELITLQLCNGTPNITAWAETLETF
ncbi:hypothetical protein BOTBODRAFT_78362, partial [Botryobasidium botryosum FD-172 SS1]